MDTLDKSCSFCQHFRLVPGLPPSATIPVPIKPGYLFRWHVLGTGKTAIPAPKGSWANRGPISLLIPTFCMDPLIQDLNFVQDVPESFNSSCKLDLRLVFPFFFFFSFFYLFHSYFKIQCGDRVMNTCHLHRFIPVRKQARN